MQTKNCNGELARIAEIKDEAAEKERLEQCNKIMEQMKSAIEKFESTKKLKENFSEKNCTELPENYKNYCQELFEKWTVAFEKLTEILRFRKSGLVGKFLSNINKFRKEEQRLIQVLKDENCNLDVKLEAKKTEILQKHCSEIRNLYSKAGSKTEKENLKLQYQNLTCKGDLPVTPKLPSPTPTPPKQHQPRKIYPPTAEFFFG